MSVIRRVGCLIRSALPVMAIAATVPAHAIDSGAALTDAEQAFLARHWPERIAPQGAAPQTWPPLEASLAAEDCGRCHQQQYQDWQTTLHSKSMGPGVLGQLVELVKSDPATAWQCWSCHTPLAEQQNSVYASDARQWQSNRLFDAKLQHSGLVCAACHVRQHQRYGPPRRGPSGITGRMDGPGLPHDGFIAASAFTKSGFCRGCHQFEPGDFALNGKLIENTYNEWAQSDYAAKGIQCQTCHMPDRRHLWRGIHDPEMVKSGVTVTVDVPPRGYGSGDTLEAVITVANTGVGHYFPTYLTPRVLVRAVMLDADGVARETTLQQAVIGREVTPDLSEELFDTRIPPGDSVDIHYVATLPGDNMTLRVAVEVEPDYFYERFYAALLDNDSAGDGRALIEQALNDARQSSFTLYERTIPLATGRADSGR